MQARFEALRQAHFPAGRNLVPAHLTLFHALPGDAAAEVHAACAAHCTGAPFPVEITGLRFLGRGVAYALASPGLAARRAGIARRFAGRLTRQDAQGFRPHVTIQNKVAPDIARALHDVLAAGFTPETVDAAAFHLWRYRDGPWSPEARFDLGRR